jgi:hypothetical protein
MENDKSEPLSDRWNLYFDTVVSVGDCWGSGLDIVIERKPTGGIFEMGLGHVLDPAVSKASDQTSDEEGLFFKVALSFHIEEIPRLIAIFNEIYVRHYEETFDEIRLDEEMVTGDNDDRIATLKAYRVFADTLTDFAQKTGLLRDYQ